MSGGIELAGLVLATLPLCVEAGKAYYRGIDVLGNLVRHSHRDEKLSEFYEDFYWNINELEGYIQEISIIAAAGTSQPASIFDVNQWHAIPGVTEGLKRAFGDDAGYHQYIVTIERIARLLTLLLHNEPEYINRTSMVRSIIVFYFILTVRRMRARCLIPYEHSRVIELHIRRQVTLSRDFGFSRGKRREIIALTISKNGTNVYTA